MSTSSDTHERLTALKNSELTPGRCMQTRTFRTTSQRTGRSSSCYTAAHSLLRAMITALAGQLSPMSAV